MHLPEVLVLRAYRTRRLPGRHARSLLRYMRTHRRAFLGGADLPSPPPCVAASFSLSALVALHRLSIEQPALCIAGLVLALPATMLFGLTVARWSAALLNLGLSRFGGGI